jgi:hypothetical protein
MTPDGEHEGLGFWFVGIPVGALFLAVPFVVTSFWLGRLVVAAADALGPRPRLGWCFAAILALEVGLFAIHVVRARRSSRS